MWRVGFFVLYASLYDFSTPKHALLSPSPEDLFTSLRLL
nr:MAG TPA: hypothetical protein [Caudoviricetes sp.]